VARTRANRPLRTAAAGPHANTPGSEKSYRVESKDIQVQVGPNKVTVVTLNYVRFLLRQNTATPASDDGQLTVQKTSRGYFTLAPVTLSLHVQDAQGTDVWKETFQLSVACTDKGAIDGDSYSIPKNVFGQADSFYYSWDGGSWDKC